MLPDPTQCCVPCDDVVTAQTPGPAGEDGEAGADGINGENSFTALTASFVMPAEGGTVVAAVGSSAFAVLGQILFVQNAGELQVSAIPGATSLTLLNLENTGTGAYTTNAAPTTVIASGSKVGPGGRQGPAGVVAGALLSANNLSDVAAAATARTNLGLGSVNNTTDATKPVSAAQAAADAVVLAAAIAASQPLDAFLTSIAALGSAADRMILITGLNTAAEIVVTATGRALLDDADTAAQRQTLSVLPKQGLLGSLIGADFNSTADQAIAVAAGVTKFVIRRIVVVNASVNMTTAAGGVYGALAKSAPIAVAATQVYTALTAAAKFVDLTLTALCGTDVFTATTLYLSLTTGQGVAATADIFIFGDVVQ